MSHFPLSHFPHFLLSHFLRFRPIRMSCLYSVRIREREFSETRIAPVLADLLITTGIMSAKYDRKMRRGVRPGGPSLPLSLHRGVLGALLKELFCGRYDSLIDKYRLSAV